MNKIELVLRAMPGTAAQLVERTGLDRTAVYRACRAAVENNRAHIGEYVFHGRNPAAALYRAGEGVNAEKPVPKPRDMASVMRRHRDKVRGGPPRKWTRREKVEAPLPSRVNPAFDSLTAAFFGRKP